MLKGTILLACLATLSSALSTYASADNSTTNLTANAPSAKDLAGVHLLLENDVDSQTSKHPVIFLSKPRSYNDSQAACKSLGEKLITPDTGNLTRLLNNTPVAQAEVKLVTRIWVGQNNSSSSSVCTAIDRQTGRTIQLSCSIQLPALCSNSLKRFIAGTNVDRSKQIRVDVPKYGAWQGYRDQNQFRFLGIPYAEPPVGQRRFMAPMPIDMRNFTGNATSPAATKVNDATEYGHVCIQSSFGNMNSTNNMTQDIQLLGGTQSEDCLYLNVFTPSLKNGTAKGLPVMVWIHGGGYVTGSGSTPIYEPGNLVSRGGVVVVSLNYRLSIFGQFENTPAIPRSKAPGNLATRDQIAALQWVRNNIGAFGGDPRQVTIFGQSAGGYSMRALLSTPSAFGLYQNVISQSDLMGSPFVGPKFSSDNIGNQTMQNLGCQPSDLACAQNKTVDEISAAQSKALSRTVNMTEYAWVPFAVYLPTVDGSLIPQDFAELVTSGRYNKKAKILWGTTRDEGGLFVPMYYPNPVPIQDGLTNASILFRENRTEKLFTSSYYQFNSSDNDTVRNEYSKAMTDYLFACPLQMMSRGVATQKSNVYAYRMDHGYSVSKYFGVGDAQFCHDRVCHGDDLAPTFGSADAIRGLELTGDDARFSRQIIDRWSTFAWTGNPNPKNGQPGLASENRDVNGIQWPTYIASNNPLLALKLQNSTVETNNDTAKCNWIAKNVQYDYQVHGPGGKFVPVYPPLEGSPTSTTSSISVHPTMTTMTSVTPSPAPTTF
ncbi:hypothetical protein BGX28_007044 [Mortierella sp. GBA30]|nr:hypothetical protein BGX28_007044 [Mortierella sp. GBA30]